MDAATGDEAGPIVVAGGVAGVAAAGDEQQAGLGAPAVGGAGAERLGEVAKRVEAGIGAPVGGAELVVVAVVGGGALVDAAVGADAELDRLPVVMVVGEQSAPASSLRSASSVRQSTTWTNAVSGSRAPVRCTRPSLGPSPQLVSRQRRKSTGIARDPASKTIVGMWRRTSFPTSVPYAAISRGWSPHPSASAAAQRIFSPIARAKPVIGNRTPAATSAASSSATPSSIPTHSTVDCPLSPHRIPL